MYCPLYKTEYRKGVSTCSDCQIPLVRSQEEAATAPVRTALEGGNRQEFDQILRALDTAGIPFHAKESIERQASSWISTFFAVISLFSSFVKPRPLAHFSLWVFAADLPRARIIVSQITEDSRREYEE
jgi:hypothetical protein